MAKNLELVGRVVFYIGLIVSVAAGMVDIGMEGLYALTVLGVIVGLLNVTGKELQTFLLSTLTLVITGIALAGVLGGIPVAANIISAFVAFVAGAALVVALREVIVITKSK